MIRDQLREQAAGKRVEAERLDDARDRRTPAAADKFLNASGPAFRRRAINDEKSWADGRRIERLRADADELERRADREIQDDDLDGMRDRVAELLEQDQALTGERGARLAARLGPDLVAETRRAVRRDLRAAQARVAKHEDREASASEGGSDAR